MFRTFHAQENCSVGDLRAKAYVYVYIYACLRVYAYIHNMHILIYAYVFQIFIVDCYGFFFHLGG